MTVVTEKEILDYLHLDSMMQSDVEAMLPTAINICARILRRPILLEDAFSDAIPRSFRPTINTAIKFICWQMHYNRDKYNQNEIDRVLAALFEAERKVVF